MKKKDYAPELTREYLEKLGIEDVDPAGRFIIRNGKPMPIYSNGSKREYLTVSLYDPEIRKNTPVEKRTRYTGNFQLCVHVINYTWHHGIKPAGLVCDHINNNSLDNRIENLQLLTQAENVAKDIKPSTKQLKCRLDKPLSFYEDKLNEYIAEYEKAKKARDAKACHNLSTNISNTKARIRYWLAHQEEAEKLLSEPKEKKGYVKDEHYHQVAEMKRVAIAKSKELPKAQGKLIRRFVKLYKDDRDYNTLKELYNALGGN